jgi:hypothetical protein
MPRLNRHMLSKRRKSPTLLCQGRTSDTRIETIIQKGPTLLQIRTPALQLSVIKKEELQLLPNILRRLQNLQKHPARTQPTHRLCLVWVIATTSRMNHQYRPLQGRPYNTILLHPLQCPLFLPRLCLPPMPFHTP